MEVSGFISVFPNVGEIYETMDELMISAARLNRGLVYRLPASTVRVRAGGSVAERLSKVPLARVRLRGRLALGGDGTSLCSAGLFFEVDDLVAIELPPPASLPGSTP